MITEKQEELAALHAFGLLEGAEKAEFESQLTDNLELRALVASLTETAVLTALSAPQMDPPAELKARIMAIAAETAPEKKVVSFSFLKFAPWAIAAGLALAATWLGSQNFSLQTENSSLRTERELAETAYKMAKNQLTERSLLAENMINDLGNKLRKSEDLARLKVTALASLAGNTKQAQVIAVWDPEQQTGLLTMEKLPAISDTQDYQIWVVDPAYKDPVNGGVFHVSADGKIALPFKPDQPVAQAAAFAISLEKKGGVAKADGTIVLLGK
jgi:anti-sigma-K factor RskA